MQHLFSGLLSFRSPSWLPQIRATTAFCCYLLIYIGIGAMLSRWLRTIVADAKSAHLRILTFFIFGAGLIAPLIPTMINPRIWRTYSLMELSNPFETYDAITNVNPVDFIRAMPVLLIATAIVVLLNVRAMYRGVREIVVDAPAPASSHADRAAASSLATQESAV